MTKITPTTKIECITYSLRAKKETFTVFILWEWKGSGILMKEK